MVKVSDILALPDVDFLTLMQRNNMKIPLEDLDHKNVPLALEQKMKSSGMPNWAVSDPSASRENSPIPTNQCTLSANDDNNRNELSDMSDSEEFSINKERQYKAFQRLQFEECRPLCHFDYFPHFPKPSPDDCASPFFYFGSNFDILSKQLVHWRRFCDSQTYARGTSKQDRHHVPSPMLLVFRDELLQFYANPSAPRYAILTAYRSKYFDDFDLHGEDGIYAGDFPFGSEFIPWSVIVARSRGTSRHEAGFDEYRRILGLRVAARGLDRNVYLLENRMEQTQCATWYEYIGFLCLLHTSIEFTKEIRMLRVSATALFQDPATIPGPVKEQLVAVFERMQGNTETGALNNRDLFDVQEIPVTPSYIQDIVRICKPIASETYPGHDGLKFHNALARMTIKCAKREHLTPLIRWAIAEFYKIEQESVSPRLKLPPIQGLAVTGQHFQLDQLAPLVNIPRDQSHLSQYTSPGGRHVLGNVENTLPRITTLPTLVESLETQSQPNNVPQVRKRKFSILDGTADRNSNGIQQDIDSDASAGASPRGSLNKRQRLDNDRAADGSSTGAQAAQARKRGRPPKESLPSVGSSLQTPPKVSTGQRGRPRKHPLPTATEGTALLGASTSSAVAGPSAPRPRGRPRKEADAIVPTTTTTTASAPRPGRDKGGVSHMSIHDILNHPSSPAHDTAPPDKNSAGDSITNANNDASNDASKPRGRGRPRKNPDTALAVKIPSGRGRGRPRKNPETGPSVGGNSGVMGHTVQNVDSDDDMEGAEDDSEPCTQQDPIQQDPTATTNSGNTGAPVSQGQGRQPTTFTTAATAPPKLPPISTVLAGADVYANFGEGASSSTYAYSHHTRPYHHGPFYTAAAAQQLPPLPPPPPQKPDKPEDKPLENYVAQLASQALRVQTSMRDSDTRARALAMGRRKKLVVSAKTGRPRGRPRKNPAGPTAAAAATDGPPPPPPPAAATTTGGGPAGSASTAAPPAPALPVPRPAPAPAARGNGHEKEDDRDGYVDVDDFDDSESVDSSEDESIADQLHQKWLRSVAGLGSDAGDESDRESDKGVDVGKDDGGRDATRSEG